MASLLSRPNISKVQKEMIFCQHRFKIKSTITFKIVLKELIDDY